MSKCDKRFESQTLSNASLFEAVLRDIHSTMICHIKNINLWTIVWFQLSCHVTRLRVQTMQCSTCAHFIMAMPNRFWASSKWFISSLPPTPPPLTFTSPSPAPAGQAQRPLQTFFQYLLFKAGSWIITDASCISLRVLHLSLMLYRSGKEREIKIK